MLVTQRRRKSQRNDKGAARPVSAGVTSRRSGSVLRGRSMCWHTKEQERQEKRNNFWIVKMVVTGDLD